MITTTRRLLCFCILLASAQSSAPHTTPLNVLEAIRVCREKLTIDPHFPRIQHSLAQLLDSNISNVDVSVDTESIKCWPAIIISTHHNWETSASDEMIWILVSCFVQVLLPEIYFTTSTKQLSPYRLIKPRWDWWAISPYCISNNHASTAVTSE